MESELGISAASIYRILTENLGYIKVCAKFVPHTMKSHEKVLRSQHSKVIIKEAKQNRNFLYSIVTGGETCCFQYEPENKRQTSKWQPREEPKPKKLAKRSQKSSQCWFLFTISRILFIKNSFPLAKQLYIYIFGTNTRNRERPTTYSKLWSA